MKIVMFIIIVLLHFGVLLLAVKILNFILKKVVKEKYDTFGIWKKIYGYKLVPAILTAAIMIYGYFNMMNVQKTYYEIYTDKDIREEGYRICLIADVHFGISVDIDGVYEICRQIEKDDVDIVVLCGDITDESTSKEEMSKIYKALGDIESEIGTYFVYGNHDRQMFGTKEYTEEELNEQIEKNNIRIVNEEAFNITNDFVIAGREDYFASEKSKEDEIVRKDVDKLLENVSREDFIMVLDHEPKEYEENSRAGTDLILSGHTHAGQIWPANILFEIVKFDDAVYGHTRLNDMQAIVTSGFAGWGYTIKTSAPAEYVIIDVKER